MNGSRQALAAGWAVLALLVATVPAGAQAPACVSLAVAAVPSSADVAAGLEGGSIAAWLAPVTAGIRASQTLDLAARVELPAELTGSHLLELRYLLPGGALYQSIAFPIAPQTLAAAALAAVPGYPFPVPVHRPSSAAKSTGSWTVEQGLPVAGTPILDSSLYGTWGLAAYLDQSETPCTAPLAFDLQP